jgi:anti-sigma B factor antagonist
MLLDIQQRRIPPDIAVMELTGKLALGRESQRIETLVDELIAGGGRKAIIDLTKVDYIDSAGIGLLALAAGKLKESGGRLALVASPGGRVLQMLNMTQVTAIVNVVQSFAEAEAAVAGAARENDATA